MHSRVAAIKDILTEEHRAARLHFARRYVHYLIEFWRWVIFTDENHGHPQRTDNSEFGDKKNKDSVGKIFIP
jgi:hypothetical protein